ncbi:MAG: hypothetical protein AB1641_22035 [Thermodesulfobacteriota bacterium]
MNIKIVIPVVNLDLAQTLLACLAQGALQPARITIINNTGQPWPTDISKGISRNKNFTQILNPPQPLPVNASWRLGFERLGVCELVSILNDDIEVGPRFLERIARIFHDHPEAAVVCPATSRDKHDMTDGGPIMAVPMRRREDWVFTIRREVLDSIPPIPIELQTFCGDDWIWHWSRRGGPAKRGIWLKDVGQTIWHQVGASIDKLGVRADLPIERQALSRLIEQTDLFSPSCPSRPLRRSPASSRDSRGPSRPSRPGEPSCA